MNTPMQQYMVVITEPKVGPKKPVQRRYVVCAVSTSTARAAFIEEMGVHQMEGGTVSIVPCGCRVMIAA